MSRGLNKVMVIGYLGRDPEMRFTPNGKPVTNFSIACDRTWKGSDGKKHSETEWFNVVTWGHLAEISKNSLVKGNIVYIEGRLQSRQWKDKEGTKKSSIEIIAQDVILLSEKTTRDTKRDDLEDNEEYPF